MVLNPCFTRYYYTSIIKGIDLGYLDPVTPVRFWACHAYVSYFLFPSSQLPRVLVEWLYPWEERVALFTKYVGLANDQKRESAL